MSIGYSQRSPMHLLRHIVNGVHMQFRENVSLFQTAPCYSSQPIVMVLNLKCRSLTDTALSRPHMHTPDMNDFPALSITPFLLSIISQVGAEGKSCGVKGGVSGDDTSYLLSRGGGHICGEGSLLLPWSCRTAALP